MRFRIFNHSINSVLAFTILLVILTFLSAGGLMYWKFASSVKSNVKKNVEIQEANEQFLILSESKLGLSRIVNDVDQTIISIQQYLITNNADLELSRNKIWDRSIVPHLDEIESRLDDIEDKDFKVRFNLLYDQVLSIKNIQDQIITTSDQEEKLIMMDKMGELSLKTTNLFNNLIAASEGKQLSIYEDANFIKENRVLIIVLVLLVAALCSTLYAISKQTIWFVLKGIERNLVSIKDGNVPDELEVEFVETRRLVRAVNSVAQRLNKIIQFADQIGQGDFRSIDKVEFSNDGDVGRALNEMQLTIARVAEEDEKRNRINEGLARFSEILGNYTNNLQRFGDEVILNLVHFLNANQGAFFVVNGEGDEESMELLSTYANNKKKYIEGRVKKGQGLVGQAWIERKSIYMTEVPKNYVNVTSGLGYSTPRCILVIPLLFNEEVHGVLELASFTELKDYELGFVEKVSENIASALSSVKVNSRTQDLLNQYGALNEKMKSQEIEMEEKINRLKTIQTESIEREEEYLTEIKRLKKRLEEYELHL